MMKMNLTRTFGAMASTPVIKFKMNIQFNDSLNDLINWNTHPRWRGIATEQYSSCRWESAAQQTLHNLWKTITRCQKHSSRRSISIQIYDVQFCSGMCYIQDWWLLSIWKKKNEIEIQTCQVMDPGKRRRPLCPPWWEMRRTWVSMNFGKLKETEQT